MKKENVVSGVVFESRNDYSHIPDKEEYDLAVIGMGVSGYACSMYASRLGLRVLLLGEQPGGTLALTGKVENYPGFVSIDGQKLTELLENHAMDYDVDSDITIVDELVRVKRGFKIVAGKKNYRSRAVVLATGAKVKELGVKGEREFFKKGVNYCALCDAASIKGKTVAVAGGGDSAVKEAILVTEYAKKVYLVNNEKNVHPEAHNKKILDGLRRKGKIEVINDNEIIEISGKGRVESIILKRYHNGRSAVPVQGVFVYIGHEPRSELARMVGARINKNKEVIIDACSATNVEGFFASGDVTNSGWKQAIIGVSQGVSAAYHAYLYVNQLR